MRAVCECVLYWKCEIGHLQKQQPKTRRLSGVKIFLCLPPHVCTHTTTHIHTNKQLIIQSAAATRQRSLA